MKNSQERGYTPICMKFPLKNITRNENFGIFHALFLQRSENIWVTKIQNALSSFQFFFPFEDQNISFLFLKHDITESLNETAMFELSFSAFFDIYQNFFTYYKCISQLSNYKRYLDGFELLGARGQHLKRYSVIVIALRYVVALSHHALILT
jgi:hypothetical protein